MIKVLRTGKYSLLETKEQTKLLVLDATHTYAWINAKGIGEILVTTKSLHKIDSILCKGSFRLYSIKKEPKLTDLEHLELFVGEGLWQGYLLPTGFPTDKKNKSRIIPTKEIITNIAISLG